MGAVTVVGAGAGFSVAAAGAGFTGVGAEAGFNVVAAAAGRSGGGAGAGFGVTAAGAAFAGVAAGVTGSAARGAATCWRGDDAAPDACSCGMAFDAVAGAAGRAWDPRGAAASVATAWAAAASTGGAHCSCAQIVDPSESFCAWVTGGSGRRASATLGV